MKPDRVESILGNCEFFKGFGESDIRSIAQICTPRTYKTGEYVFQQGDFGEQLYVICDGQVFLEHRTNIGNKKGNVVFATLGRGRVLGCWSTLLNAPHILMSSATCQRPTTVLEMKGADLRQMMTGNTEFGFIMLERLCFLLRDRIQAAIGAMEKM